MSAAMMPFFGTTSNFWGSITGGSLLGSIELKAPNQMIGMNIFRDYFTDIAFAVSGKPTVRRREQMKAQVDEADCNRAKGIMSSLSRGSVLLQQEEISDSGSTVQRSEH